MKNKKEFAIVTVCSVFIVLLLVLNLAVGTFFHYYSIVSVKKEDDYSDIVISRSDEYLSEVADVEIELPEKDTFSGNGIMNILLIGTDEHTEVLNKASRADSIMLLSLNNSTYDIKLVSFERDTFVAIPKVPKRNPDKLGHTFRFGGAELLMETLETHFGLDVSQYVRVNFSVFKKLIDEIGGVDITLTRSEANIVRYSTKLTIREGLNHLDGDAALCYARIRSLDSDWMRVKRQQNVIIAIKNSFSQKSVSDLKEIFDACLPYIQTNLSAYECAELLLNITKYANGNVSRMTLPEKGTFHNLKKVDFDANREILRKFLYDSD